MKEHIPRDEAIIIDWDERSELQALRLQMSDLQAELRDLNAEVDKAVAFLEKAGLDTERLSVLKRQESAAQNVAFSDAVEAVGLLKYPDIVQHSMLEKFRQESAAKEPRHFQEDVFEAVHTALEEHVGGGKGQMGGSSTRRNRLQRILPWLSDGGAKKVPGFDDFKRKIRAEYDRQWADAEKQRYAKYRAAGLLISLAKMQFYDHQIEKRRKAARNSFAAALNEVIDDLCKQFQDSSKLPCIITRISSSSFWPHQHRVQVHFTYAKMEPSNVGCTVQSVLPSDAGGLVPSWCPSDQYSFVLPEGDVPLLVHPIEPATSILVVTQAGQIYLVPKNRMRGPLTERETVFKVRRKVSLKASYDPAGRFLCLFSRDENQAVVYRFDAHFKTLQQMGQPINFGDHGVHQVCDAMLIPGKKVRAQTRARSLNLPGEIISSVRVSAWK